MTNDGCERNNPIADPARKAEMESMRGELLSLMKRTGDLFAEAFENLDNKELIPAVFEKLKAEYMKK